MQPRLGKPDGTNVHTLNIRVASLRRTGDKVRVPAAMRRQSMHQLCDQVQGA